MKKILILLSLLYFGLASTTIVSLHLRAPKMPMKFNLLNGNVCVGVYLVYCENIYDIQIKR